MELFFTDLAALRRPLLIEGKPLEIDGAPYELPGGALEAIANEAVPDGMPFMLLGNARYADILNKFLRDLPTSGCPSENTWIAYGRDLLTFCRFLHEKCGGKNILQTTKDDIKKYYRVRRLAGIGSVDPSTWNRSITALDKFFAWAEEENLIDAIPFSYKYATASVPSAGKTITTLKNRARERTRSDPEVKCISREQYLAFRDIGLLGKLPDGTLDPNFRGRNRLRNAALAELFVTTGCRLEEGGSILMRELPNLESPKWASFKACPMQLARLTTKGDKGRTIRVPKRVLHDYILPFLKEDRDNAVEKARLQGHYLRVDDPILVTEWRLTYCRIRQPDGSLIKVPYDKIAPKDRLRMYSTDDNGTIEEPGILAITEQGLPTTLNNIEVIFRRASERCQQFGIDLWVMPHTLRHTFAVYMLSHLIRETVGSVLALEREKNRLGEQVYRRVIGDPLRTLQRMLGHSNITSTYTYLTYLEEAQELVDQAVSSWGEQLGRPADLLTKAAQ